MTGYGDHIDLFSGIAGFSLAAQANGLKTEVFCENDKRCRQFLKRAYPGVPIIPDVRDFDGTKWRGRFLLTGGVPCQPASRAGKQGGEKDDRWLWGEALRVIEESKPRWCLLENPPGIYDVGIDGILSHLEGIGYEVGICEIPACAVNSPQIRQRVWIVGNANGTRGQRWTSRKPQIPQRNGLRPSITSQGNVADTQGRQDNSRGDGNLAEAQGCRESGNTASGSGSQSDLADTERLIERVQDTQTDSEPFKGDTRTRFRRGCRGFWDSYIWLPCADGKLRRAVDDSQRMAHGLPVELLEELGSEGRQTPEQCEVHRSILGALGNSICWPVAAEIIRAIVLTDQARV